MSLLYFEALFNPSWLLILIGISGSVWLLTMKKNTD
tara:strand:+ start:112 stop:219 length:108 start_codon:yes stop_codon:yes gene_type:complete